MNEIFNAEFDEIVPDGKEGNQAILGIFHEDKVGLFKRLTQAVGNEFSNNPETEERNTIGMQQAKTVVKSYKVKFSKDVVIEKGEENYEFFRDFNEKKFTGRNAELKMLLVDFMQSVPVGNGKQRYKAEFFMCTVSADTANWTDAKLSMSFNQSGDRVSGVADYDEETKSAVFTPSSKIDITKIVLSEDEIELGVGEEKMVSIDFEPFGAPDSFTQVSSDPSVCSVGALRQSVVITGKKAGKATVTVKDAATEIHEKEISVTVGTPSDPETLLDD